MKIPLQFYDGRLIVLVSLTSSKYRLGIAHAQFIVDTGSSVTFISDGDALRLGIPMSSLPFSQHVRMAGSVFELYEISHIKVHFKHKEEQEDKIISFDYKYYVSKSTKRDQKSRDIAQAFPSILGMDFLKENKLKLVVIPHKDIAYLEEEQ